MRLWSLHPQHLDRIGLIALWREALLAKKVLVGQTKGYRHHPQLIRFQTSGQPIIFIDKYLETIYIEALSRGYNFDVSKFNRSIIKTKLTVTNGQVDYEIDHLLKKIKQRAPNEIKRLNSAIEVNPIFEIMEGGIADWEKLA
jgi:outer membrane scaffolding protein for murein synthesis (MipA/OmpV family)